jgi:hypothetical protein
MRKRVFFLVLRFLTIPKNALFTTGFVKICPIIFIMILGATNPQLSASPPFTTLEVKTIRGIDVDRSGSTSSDGYSRKVNKITREVAVEIKYRTFKEIDAAFEIQVFFIGRDAPVDRSTGEQYVYDVHKIKSDEQDATIKVAAKNMYGGTRIYEVSTTTEAVSGRTTSGRSFDGTLTTTTYTTTKHSGGRSQGWIVRLYYKGELVKQKASLGELERFATTKADFLSDVAESTPFSSAE